ncbi:MAG: hypothetical protein GY952_04585 [Rhodobacteraceae bacterium]|nr:hypothetical protein [Paracoccaceae bacterium]
MKYAVLLIGLFIATPLKAEVYMCKATKAHEISGTGLVVLPDDYHGVAAYSSLEVDTDEGRILATGVGELPGIESVGGKSADRQNDVVFVAPDDGSFYFRMRGYEADLPFILTDAYVVFSGNCTRQ